MDLALLALSGVRCLSLGAFFLHCGDMCAVSRWVTSVLGDMARTTPSMWDSSHCAVPPSSFPTQESVCVRGIPEFIPIYYYKYIFLKLQYF